MKSESHGGKDRGKEIQSKGSFRGNVGLPKFVLRAEKDYVRRPITDCQRQQVLRVKDKCQIVIG